MTPIGTRTRPTCIPFGLVHIAGVWPMGSGSFATSRIPAAISAIRLSVSRSRSAMAFLAGEEPKVIGRDMNGTQIRRVYFQLDNDLSVRYATRFRLEVDGKSLTSDNKLGVNVKAAYLQAKSIVPRGDGFFGVLTTPIWENPEEFWGYRSLEKTIADFRGLGSSADLGLEDAEVGNDYGESGAVDLLGIEEASQPLVAGKVVQVRGRGLLGLDAVAL